MTLLATGAMVKAATALTAAIAGAALSTAPAAAATPTPDALAPSAVAAQSWGAPSWDPHRRAFRAHFRSYAECRFFADHDRNPRTNGWDCRHGGDRRFPWEYWY